MEIGLQLYSIRTDTAANLLERLEKVKALGFDTVEFAGFEGYDAKTLRAKLDQLGLSCSGSHTMVEDLLADAAGVIAFHQELGASSIICPYHVCPEGEDAVSHWRAYADQLTEAGKLVAAAGMSFGYHNHSHEFEAILDTTPLDIIFTHTDPALVKLELDTCWVENAGVKAVDVMRRYEKAMLLLHIKELTAVGDPTPQVIGTGCLDFPAILAVAKQVGVKTLIVEHEATSGDLYGDLAAGLSYLRSITG